MIPDEFPERAFPVDYAIKDLRLALQLAAESGVPVGAAQQTMDLLQRAHDAGLGAGVLPGDDQGDRGSCLSPARRPTGGCGRSAPPAQSARLVTTTSTRASGVAPSPSTSSCSSRRTATTSSWSTPGSAARPADAAAGSSSSAGLTPSGPPVSIRSSCARSCSVTCTTTTPATSTTSRTHRSCCSGPSWSTPPGPAMRHQRLSHFFEVDDVVTVVRRLFAGHGHPGRRAPRRRAGVRAAPRGGSHPGPAGGAHPHRARVDRAGLRRRPLLRQHHRSQPVPGPRRPGSRCSTVTSGSRPWPTRPRTSSPVTIPGSSPSTTWWRNEHGHLIAALHTSPTGVTGGTS